MSATGADRLGGAIAGLGDYDLLRTLDRRLRAEGLHLPGKPGDSREAVVVVRRHFATAEAGRLLVTVARQTAGETDAWRGLAALVDEPGRGPRSSVRFGQWCQTSALPSSRMRRPPTGHHRDH